MEKRIKVLIAEDSKLTVVGLKATLSATNEFEIVGMATNGQVAVDKAIELTPDIILMDIGMPIIDGIQATKIIKKKNSEIKIIMLTSHEGEEDVLEALTAGANSYCMKEIEPKELINVIKTTNSGASWLDPKIAGIVLESLKNEDKKPAKKNSLTEREVEILGLVSKGYSNMKISEVLYISLNTVKTHIKNIFEKLEVEDRTQAAMKAVKEDLIKE